MLPLVWKGTELVRSLMSREGAIGLWFPLQVKRHEHSGCVKAFECYGSAGFIVFEVSEVARTLHAKQVGVLLNHCCSKVAASSWHPHTCSAVAATAGFLFRRSSSEG
jgi:hypothetical protein